MARSYVIAGVRFYRRSVIALSANERGQLHAQHHVTVRRSVEWPLDDRRPFLSDADADPGGTDIWGSGPYLKVPNSQPGTAEPEAVNRVLCPWGYPPDTIRVSRRGEYVHLGAVRLVRDGEWFWELDLKEGQGPVSAAEDRRAT